MSHEIPVSFEMLGHTIRVFWVDKLISEDSDDCWGESDYEANVILLEKPGPDTDPEILIQTFWHEWMHFARHYVVPNPSVDEETFADLMGAAMHQFHRTAKYGPPKTRKKSPKKKSKARG